MSFFHSSLIISEIKTDLKELISDGKIQPLKNGKEFTVPLHPTNKPLVITF